MTPPNALSDYIHANTTPAEHEFTAASPVAEQSSDSDTGGSDAAGDVPEPEAQPEPIDPEAASARVAMAKRNCGEAGRMVIVTKEAERTARAKLAQAVTAFQRATGAIPPSQSEVFRDYAKQQAAMRVTIATGKVQAAPSRQPVPGPSAVDRIAFYGRGGNPAGGGNAFRRGAVTQKGRPNFNRVWDL